VRPTNWIRTYWRSLVVGMGIGVTICAPTLIEEYNYCHNLHGKTHYRLMVSPTFTQQQQQEVRNAAHKWEVAVGRPKALTISVQVGLCPSVPDMVEGCLIPIDKTFHCGEESLAVGCTIGMTKWHYSQVNIDIACRGAFTHLIEHEIGHVLGMFDSNQKNTVMYRYVDCSEVQSAAAQDVSQTDAQEYLKMH
jgi:Matrixin